MEVSKKYHNTFKYFTNKKECIGTQWNFIVTKSQMTKIVVPHNYDNVAGSNVVYVLNILQWNDT